MINKRLDFLIEEAGCLIWVAPRSLGGLSAAELAEVWMGQVEASVHELVQRGAMMPMSLYQDDGYVVRFVLGDLTAQEASDWTARVAWKLDVPCGEVLVSGTLSPDFEEEFSAIELAEPNGSYGVGAYVEVPPGKYKVEVFSYPPGDLSSGWGMITDPRTFGKHPAIQPEKPREYFRRTRPNEQPPAWMSDESEGYLYVDFVVRLSELQEDPALPELEEDGCIRWEFRKPDVFPKGISSGISDE